MKNTVLFLLFFVLLGINNSVFAQTQKELKPVNTAEEYEKQHKRNVRKSRINGVYIPKNVDDAIQQLVKLSTKKSLGKFKKAPEESVAEKLHFGIGRWMIVNWNFYEGSRFEQYLRNLGLGHPDDMADFMIISLHRFLNEKDLNTKDLVESFKKKRLDAWKKRKVVRDTIEVRKRKR